LYFRTGFYHGILCALFLGNLELYIAMGFFVFYYELVCREVAENAWM
jgi:hypothetical protein